MRCEEVLGACVNVLEVEEVEVREELSKSEETKDKLRGKHRDGMKGGGGGGRENGRREERGKDEERREGEKGGRCSILICSTG